MSRSRGAERHSADERKRFLHDHAVVVHIARATLGPSSFHAELACCRPTGMADGRMRWAGVETGSVFGLDHPKSAFTSGSIRCPHVMGLQLKPTLP